MESRNAVSLKWTGAFSGSQRRWFTLIAVVFVVATWLPSASAQAGAQTPPPVLDGTAKLVQPANTSQTLRIVLGMERPHAAEEEQFLRDLHTKGSKDYRHFLTAEEWNARFGPSKQNEQAVVDWAKSQGLTVTARFPHRLLVAVEGPVKLLQNAFNVTINNYQIGNEVHFSNDRDPQITGSTSGLVHSVTGLNDIQVLQPGSAGTEPIMPIYSPGPVKGAMASGGANGDHKKLLAAMAAKKNGQVTPNLTNNFYDPTDLYGSNAYDFNALYAQGHCCNPFGISGGTPPVTSIAIATAGSQNTNDFAGFQAQYPYLAYHYFTIPINGTPTCCDKEGTLDFEWATAMSNSFGALTNTSSVFMYQGANASLETFTIMFGQILADGHARTMSVSWGCAEISCYDTKTMDTDHGIFNSMSGQGWTLVGIAHDHGATADCSTISVSYPGSDPDMVSAGGTTLSLFNNSTYNNEVAWTGGTAPGSCVFPTNNGGGGGGCSAHFGAPGYQGNSPACGAGSRSVPDISLNAAIGQNYFYNGALQGTGGTSIVAPELAGFFAQENAYLYWENFAVIGNSCTNSTCAPIGLANYYIYDAGLNSPYAAHYPFYDITAGCNSNDITLAKGLNAFCAFGGYDLATGWGSFNALQLAWYINTYLAGDFGAPATTFTGPKPGLWHNTDQTISWTIQDTSNNGSPDIGVAGFSQAWDSDPGDSYSQPTPGQGNSFYSGPEFPNATNGALSLAAAGQGCHTVNVRSWDNAGWGSLGTYGPVCYDIIPPATTPSSFPPPNSVNWNNTSVQVTLTANDPGAGSTGAGVYASFYSIDDNSCSWTNLTSCIFYSGPINVTTEGVHNVYDFSSDNAGNAGLVHRVPVNIDRTVPVTGASFSGTASVAVALHATDNLSGVAGTVYQLDGGTLTNYTAPFTVTAAGSHTVTFHSTDRAGNVEGAKSASFKVLGKSSTALVSSLNPSTYGTSVTFTASVSPATATGTVTFKSGPVTLGTLALATGKAKLVISSLTAGLHTIVAVYSGDANFGVSTSPVLTQTVKKAATATTLVSSLNPSKKGHPVTFTATVAPASGPTGTVSFMAGSKTLGNVALNPTTHKAAITNATLTVGTHSITAIYGGNANFKASTSGVVKQVVH
jgi:hypothetical protein